MYDISYRIFHIARIVFSKSVRYIVQNSHRVDGPGKVTKLFKISRALNNKKAARASGLWIEDRGVKIAPRAIMRAVRIGVSYAGPVWSKKKYRFILREHTKNNRTLYYMERIVHTEEVTKC